VEEAWRSWDHISLLLCFQLSLCVLGATEIEKILQEETKASNVYS
jgi:hypothetical protein